MTAIGADMVHRAMIRDKLAAADRERRLEAAAFSEPALKPALRLRRSNAARIDCDDFGQDDAVLDDIE